MYAASILMRCGSDLPGSAPFHAACGQRVTAIHILKRTGQGPLFTHLPNEAGVRIDLDNGDSILLAHGLHDDSDDFAVLHPEEVLPEIAAALHVSLTVDQPS